MIYIMEEIFICTLNEKNLNPLDCEKLQGEEYFIYLHLKNTHERNPMLGSKQPRHQLKIYYAIIKRQHSGTYLPTPYSSG